MRSIIKKTKSDASSILIGLAILFVLGLIVYAFMAVFPDLMTELKGTGEIASNENAVSALGHIESFAPKLVDLFILFAFVGFAIALWVSAAFIPASPATMILYVIVLIIAVFIAMQLGGAYTEILTDANAGLSAGDLPIARVLLGNYMPLFVLLVGIVTMIILYSKSDGGGAAQI
jgi:hypothetical protein